MSVSRAALFCALMLGITTIAPGSGHGPVFGLATPTNVKGGWSLDLGMIDRIGTTEGGSMGRAMLSYGITPDIQLSVSGPTIFASAPLPPARVTAVMPATADCVAVTTRLVARMNLAEATKTFQHNSGVCDYVL